MQGIAKKLKNWEVFVAKKLIERDKRELVTYLCNRIGIPQPWVKWWLRLLQNTVKSFSDAREFYDLEWGAGLERPTFLIASKYTESYGYYGKRFWTTICSRRTILYRTEHFKEFGIILSGIETWYFRDSRNRERSKGNRWTRRLNHLTSKVEVECWIILVGLILTVVWWIVQKSPFTERNIGKIPDSLEFQSWKINFITEVCLRTVDPQVTTLWIKEVEIASIDELVWHRDWLQGSLIFLTSMCLMRWLRQPWRSISPMCSSGKELVSKSSEVRIADRFFRGRQIKHMIHEYFSATGAYEAVQGLSTLFPEVYRLTTSKISTSDGIMLYYLWVKCPPIWSWKDCTSQNWKVLLNIRLWWHCMIKKLLEIIRHRTVNNWRQL